MCDRLRRFFAWRIGEAGFPDQRNGKRKVRRMFGLFGRGVSVHNLTSEEVANGIKAGEIMLIDVREDRETALERIPNSLLMPLSRFDPMEIPDPQGRKVVFSCNSGNRSVRASEIAQAAGLPYDSHLAGGIKGWKAAGLPTET